MKTPLKLLVSLLALGLAGASAAQAADDGTISAVVPSTESPAPSAGKKAPNGKRMQGALEQRLQQLDESLQLTAEQKQKIKDIWAKQATELREVNAEDRRARAREALLATRNEVRAVLTPEQQTKFDAMKHAGGGRPGKGKKPE
jgi:Spy/CpxP family protein refolding chaperone